MALTLDEARTKIVIHTFAEGLFARLAHDLELEASGVSGRASEASEGVEAKGELEIPVAKIRVVGAVKKGLVDASTLSASDRKDIEERVHGELLAGGPAVKVSAEVEGARARLTVAIPNGGRATVSCELSTVKTGGELVASGKCDLSLKALGIPPVKGPMGAFRLSDRVEIVFRAVFRDA